MRLPLTIRDRLGLSGTRLAGSKYGCGIAKCR